MKMMNLFFLLVLGLVLHSKAEGPLYKQKDTYTQQEFDNVYQDLRNNRNFSPAKLQSQTSSGTYCDLVGGNARNGLECYVNGVLFSNFSGDFELYIDTNYPTVFLQGAISAGMPTLQPRSSGGTNPWSLGTSSFKWTSLYLSSGIVGTTTNDNAPSGYVGEYLSSNTATNVPFAASNVYSDLLSLPLTAGDWDVTGEALASLNGATCTNWELAISPTSGNSTTGLTYGINRWDLVPPTAAADNKLTMSNYRVSIVGSTTYYLKIRNTCSAGVMFSNGTFHARRPR